MLDTSHRVPAGSPAGTRAPVAGGREPGTVVLALLAACVALTPLVSPKGPGHGAPIDLLIAIGVAGTVLWAIRRKATVRLPYAVPMTALVALGLTAAMLSVSPQVGGIAMVQETFLVFWCAAIATVCRTPRALGVLLRSWSLSTTAWGLLLIVGVVTRHKAISGATGAEGGRARLFFDQPNMAGNYFMIAVFVVVASGCPRRLWARIGACTVLVLAMFLTGSNAALLSLISGSVLVLFLWLKVRSGLVTATAVIALMVGGLGVGWVEIGAPLVSAAQQSDNPLLRYSVGRGERSAGARESLFSSQFAIYERGNLLGIGPAGTRDALGSAAATTVKEAHNDYLGTLTERGPLGLLALFGLLGAVWARATSITGRRLPAHLARVVPVPAALAGACAAFAITALTHEVLHFRWLWTLLGLVAALHLLLREAGDPGAAAVPTAVTGGTAERGGH